MNNMNNTYGVGYVNDWIASQQPTNLGTMISQGNGTTPLVSNSAFADPIYNTPQASAPLAPTAPVTPQVDGQQTVVPSYEKYRQWFQNAAKGNINPGERFKVTMDLLNDLENNKNVGAIRSAFAKNPEMLQTIVPD